MGGMYQYQSAQFHIFIIIIMKALRVKHGYLSNFGIVEPVNVNSPNFEQFV